MEEKALKYIIRDPLELNLSYMPFVKRGGLFIPTREVYMLGDTLSVEVELTNKNETIFISGKVVWITPINALHSVVAGIGIQFIGDQADTIRGKLEANMDRTLEKGGYTCGITDESKRVSV